MPIARWYIEFQAQHPDDPAKTWTVGVHEGKIKLLRNKSHEAKLARCVLVKQVVEEPLFIARGWLRLEKEDCLIYGGKPATDFRSRNIQVPAPPGWFFLAFVLPDGTIDDWAWRLPSAENADKPQDVAGEWLWPKT